MIGKRRFARDRRGRIRPGLEAPELELLRVLPAQARGLLEQGEPAAQRLFPVAYPDDTEAQADYRAMMSTQLQDHHQQALDVLLDTLDAPIIGEDELRGWLGALEVLRLILGTQLDVGEEPLDIDPGDPRADQLTVYQYLSMLQAEIIDTLAAALPRAGTEPRPPGEVSGRGP